MSAPIVLVAFASQSGSTAGIGQEIAAELRAAGFAVHCRPASEVTSVVPYGAVVLGSGVFVPSRASDGGGFLARHAGTLGARPVWLFCAGPIGRGHVDHGTACDSSLMHVARSVGAWGAAAFGSLDPSAAPGTMDRPVDTTGVRAWARGIAASLGRAPAPGTRGPVAAGCARLAAAS